MQITSQITVWHHCCIWRAISWHGPLTSCVWKHLAFGSQCCWCLGQKNPSRPLMDSGGSLCRKPYFRILTKCLLKYMGMWFLKAVIDLIFYYCFSCSPLTTGTRLWVGAVVCMCLDSLRGTNDLSPPPLLTHPLLEGLQQKQQSNCQSSLETVNHVYTNVEYLW